MVGRGGSVLLNFAERVHGTTADRVGVCVWEREREREREREGKHGKYAWVKTASSSTEADPVRMRVLLEAGLGRCDWQIKATEVWLVFADIEARGQASLHEGAATKTSQSGEQNRTQDICCTHMYTHTLSLSHTHTHAHSHAGVHICSPRAGMRSNIESHILAAKDTQSCM